MDYKALIIYHQIKKGVDCPDGIVSAWVAYRAKLKEYPIEDIAVHGRCYDQPLTDKEIAAIKKQDIKEIIIVDFSFDIDTLKKLAEFAYVTILDHHQATIDNLTKDLPEISDRILFVYDTNECAATLTWNYFNPEQDFPTFLFYIKDRDLWKFELLDSKVLNTAFLDLIRRLEQFGRIRIELLFAFFSSLSMMDTQQLYSYLFLIGSKLITEKEDKNCQYSDG